MSPWAVFLRGVAMGIAEIVPGVSGGTIAFVTGIYDELMRTLVGLSTAARVAVGLHWRAAWEVANPSFLFPLILGMGIGALGFAQVFTVLMSRYPALLAGFFMGVIATSALIVGKTAWRAATGTRSHLWVVLLGATGLAAGWILSVLNGPDTSEPSLVLIGIGGFVAISAWMVPGVSGSMVLLLLGVYPVVLNAVAGFEFDVLLPLFAGMLAGLVVAPRIFVHLLDRYRPYFLMFLAGAMLVSTRSLNPWDASETVPLLPTGGAILIGALLVYLGARRSAS